MKNLVSKDYDQVFEACRGFCHNCTKCVHNFAYFAQNPPITDIRLRRMRFAKEDCKCPTMQAFAQISVVNNLSFDTQFERIKYYLAVRQFLEENCEGFPRKRYTKKYDREWAQVALYTFSSLPNICQIIEGLVDERAQAKSQNFGLNMYNENTEQQANTIISLIDRKTRMINMHIKVSRVLADLPDKLLEAAKIHYFERKNIPEMSEKLHISPRTCQRRNDQLLEEVAFLMKKYGIDSDDLLFGVAQFEPWMMEWFRLDFRTL